MSLNKISFLQGGINNVFKIDLLVECARFTEDVSTRNHVFLLLSSVARASPRWLSEHMVDIFTIIGESAVKQVRCRFPVAMKSNVFLQISSFILRELIC